MSDTLTPETREEKYLAAIAGEDVEVPEPISRLEKFYMAILRNSSGVAVEEAKQAAQDAVDYVNHTFNRLDEASETLLYDKQRGKIVLVNGAFQECGVSVDKAYAGQVVSLTYINSDGEVTEECTVSDDGLVFEYLPLADGYNLITVTQTDPSGKNLPADDAINCVVRYKRDGTIEMATNWGEFLTACGLSCEYAETETPDDFTSDAYFTRQHTDDATIWDALHTSDGDYYVRIYSAPDDSETQIYTWSFTRIEESTEDGEDGGS